MSQVAPAKPRVVIIGAGFVGLYAAKALRNAPVDVVIVDQNNYHTFQPLIYQVATAALEPEEVAHGVRAIFRRQQNFAFRQATVSGVDWEGKALELVGGDTLEFDYLIIGAGAVYNDFGIPGVKEHAFYLKSLSEAVNIRSHILRQFERASADPSLIDQGALNVVIVGGGPTGVEMAGALTELFSRVLPKDYPNLDVSRAKVILVEMLDFLLPPYGERSRAYSEEVLRERGVEVRLGTALAEVRDHEVEFKGGETVPTETLIWAAGVRGNPLVDALDVELEKAARIKVNPDLSLPGHPYAFAAGDVAGSKYEDGKLHPQVAQVAIQGGKFIAKTIAAEVEGKGGRGTFTYFDKGNMAIIGRNAGVAELSKVFGGLRLRGLLGWLAWLFIHLVYLPGYRNRVNAFTDWVYSYFTFDRRARLITEMAPSPTEVTNHTDGAASEQQVTRKNREAQFVAR
ncbi:MAG: NADH dehydrogenase [uncultured Truepera sp.]|uniref:NADH:ubiquinone reductase (non-electrogenic) n=1 Tax=uncultured Truepera sp. TaxID=543023 RepID=A0A6J4VRS6_9DEIN|nr:MAG: NADH dehydrogenase [uncultured Truepera sp.]